ncbi:MAG TPA: cytochrome P450 [Pyrinomonadaceae bacterium]|nr:cytochrome P450 [Pyrinomonadaceae bacterium]
MSSRRNLPPGPGNNFPGQQLLAFRRSPTDFLTNVARRYGDISHFRLGRRAVYFLNRPEYVKDVLVTHQDNFRKGLALERAKFLFGGGLLTSEGELHRRQRRLVQPAFQRQRVAAYAEMMVRHAARVRASWEGVREFDVAREMRRLTLLVVCEALFGADVRADADAVDEAVSSVIRRFQLFPTPWSIARRALTKLTARASRRDATTRDKLDAIIFRIIRERQRGGAGGNDLLAMLLAAKDGEPGKDFEPCPMSDSQVRDEVITLFMAGHETTANALTWTWHLLSKYPEAEAKFHGELDAVLAGRLPTAEDAPRLRYTEMVFAEAMRLYPPSWILSRRAVGDYEVGGYALPAGSLVIVSPYVMHHDERYFPAPRRFDPERWTEASSASRPEYSYFPFGGGARRCIGEGFAKLEALLILATLAQVWRLKAVADEPVELQPGMVLRARHGIRLRPVRR